MIICIATWTHTHGKIWDTGGGRQVFSVLPMGDAKSVGWQAGYYPWVENLPHWAGRVFPRVIYRMSPLLV